VAGVSIQVTDPQNLLSKTSITKTNNSGRRGFTDFKPIILNVLIEVHFQGEFRNIREIIFYSKLMANFLNFESSRLDEISPSTITALFTRYFMKVLQFVALYVRKFFDANTEEQREDFCSFAEFKKILQFKVDELIQNMSKWVPEKEIKEKLENIGIKTSDDTQFSKAKAESIYENENIFRDAEYERPQQKKRNTFLSSQEDRVEFDSLWKSFKRFFIHSDLYNQVSFKYELYYLQK
jgi:hypothetical protein